MTILQENPIAYRFPTFYGFFRYRSLALPQRDGLHSFTETHVRGEAQEGIERVGAGTQYEY